MKTRLLIIFVLLFSSSCLYNKPEATENKRYIKSTVNSNMDFAFQLFSEIKTPDANLFFSPFSISTALTMTYIGSENNTEKEMRNTMKLKLDKTALSGSYKSLIRDINSFQMGEDLKLLSSNTLWPHKEYSFKKKYIKNIEKYYDADIKTIDYTNPQNAQGTINKWVEEKTENMISDLIAPGIITPTTRLLLTNTVYFKGNWEHPFDKLKTSESTFYAPSKKNVMAPMMKQTRMFNYTENDKLQALELPYSGEKLSMVLLLPKNINDFSTLESSLNSENIRLCLTKLRAKKIRVKIPKFKISSGFNLSESLVKMGMKDAFSMSADFSGMDGTRMLYLTAVLHKAFVDVNEEGTEAAAASAVVVGVKSSGRKTPYFNANHPFIFLIKENINDTILFMGRIIDPTI